MGQGLDIGLLGKPNVLILLRNILLINSVARRNA
jgi:hypothetical protein